MRGDERDDKAARAPEHHGAGHRARLRQRLLTGAEDALLDHEIVEYLLATAIPRRDTKELAKKLLSEFGGIGGLFAADAKALERIDGMGETAAAAIKIVDIAIVRVLKSKAKDRPILSSWQALLDFLRADMAFKDIEHVRVIYLNSGNMVIQSEISGKGSVDEAPIYPRQVIRRAIELSAAAIILAHNHPSGNPAPSRQDITVTRDIIDAGKPLGIVVHDHIIIGSDGHSSMRNLGLI